MKKLLSIVALLSMVLLSACGGGSSSKTSAGESGGSKKAAEVVKLKVGHTLSDTSHYQKGMEKFQELVKEKSNGTIEIEVFPNGSLGGERDMIEGLNVGSVDMVLTSTGPMSGFAPEVTVVDLPFLFRNEDHAHKVLDGKIGDDLRSKVETTMGVKTLAWWENGFRNITTGKTAVEKPEDLKGIKIRTMENDIHMDTFREFGAQPTPMSFTELFTALQQGVIDAEENPVPVIMTSRFYEVQGNLTMTRHFYNPSLLLMSTNKFDSLTNEEKKVLEEAAVEAGKYERQVVQDMEKQYISELKEKGMKVIENPNLESFKEAVKPVYKKYESVFGKELIAEIKNTK
ncbi:TRAP transporter substrate-binding protein [Neobacillus drentensis]|uniref:TRAP transporter substrate-binding protein n=1 Tax=Neobacillus drentensis TaxID=220684 RepID=UPI002FFF9263